MKKALNMASFAFTGWYLLTLDADQIGGVVKNCRARKHTFTMPDLFQISGYAAG